MAASVRHDPRLFAATAPDTLDCGFMVPVHAVAARALRLSLEPLLHALPRVAAADPVIERFDALTAARPGLLSVSLFQTAAPPGRIAVLLAAEPVMRITDRFFGGSGVAPGHDPQEFPMSAEMIAGQLASAVADALMAGWAGVHRLALEQARHENALSHIAWLDGEDRVVRADLGVTEESGGRWTISVIYPLALARALRQSLGPADAQRVTAAAGPGAFSLASPVCDVPLRLSAVIARRSLPMARLAALTVGDEIAINMGSHAELIVAGRPFGRALVGVHDGMTALRIAAVDAPLSLANQEQII